MMRIMLRNEQELKKEHDSAIIFLPPVTPAKNLSQGGTSQGANQGGSLGARHRS